MKPTGRTTPGRRAGLVGLCLLVAVLTAAACSSGLWMRGDGSFETVVSVRGERYEMATTGVYAWNARQVVGEGIGWDAFTLVFAVPALLLVLPALSRGSLRGRLFAVGILAYLFYQYLMYSLTWAFGPLFLLFVAIYALSLAAAAGIVVTIPLGELPDRFTDRFPRRGMAVLSFVLAAALLAMWLSRVARATRGEIQGVLHGQTTLVVQALDLGLIVPLALFTGVTAWRGRPIGYLLCSTVVVKAFAMAAAICAMIVSARMLGGELAIPPVVLFGGAAVACGWLGVRMYRSVRVAPPRRSASH